MPARDTLDKAHDNESLTKVCDLMSEEAQRQTIVYAKRSAGLADVKWNCENATGLLLRRASQTGGLTKSLRTKIVVVNAEGDRATASVRFGGKGRSPRSRLSRRTASGNSRHRLPAEAGGSRVAPVGDVEISEQDLDDQVVVLARAQRPGGGEDGRERTDAQREQLEAQALSTLLMREAPCRA